MNDTYQGEYPVDREEVRTITADVRRPVHQRLEFLRDRVADELKGTPKEYMYISEDGRVPRQRIVEAILDAFFGEDLDHAHTISSALKSSQRMLDNAGPYLYNPASYMKKFQKYHHGVETGADVPVSTDEELSWVDDGASDGIEVEDDTANQEDPVDFESKIGDASTTDTGPDGVIGPPLDDIGDEEGDDREPVEPERESVSIYSEGSEVETDVIDLGVVDHEYDSIEDLPLLVAEIETDFNKGAPVKEVLARVEEDLGVERSRTTAKIEEFKQQGELYERQSGWLTTD